MLTHRLWLKRDRIFFFSVPYSLCRKPQSSLKKLINHAGKALENRRELKWYIPLRRNYILINVFIYFFTIILKIGRWHKYYNKCKIRCMPMLARLGTSNISERNWWWVWINLLVRIFLSCGSLCLAAPPKAAATACISAGLLPRPPSPSLSTRPTRRAGVGWGELGTRELKTRAGRDRGDWNTTRKS